MYEYDQILSVLDFQNEISLTNIQKSDIKKNINKLIQL